MWLDYLDLRLSAARNLFSIMLAALTGMLFGAIGAWAGTAATGDTWGALVGLAVVYAIAMVVGRRTLGGSEHRALEQRWLLYRERARQLGLP